MPNYVAPFLTDASSVSFTCPVCSVLAQHTVEKLTKQTKTQVITGETFIFDNSTSLLRTTQCTSCGSNLVWQVPKLQRLDGSGHEYSITHSKIVFPAVQPLPICSADTPELPAKLYMEARSVFGSSNRACATLLRCALEALLREKLESDKMLGLLLAEKSDEMPEALFDAAKALQLVGNDGAHSNARVIDLDEVENEFIEGLFFLFNEVVNELITKPNRQSALLAKIKGEKEK
jgi:predicted RNA-binding Zn-ribbon protein involved in translation (DUF1610 family)